MPNANGFTVTTERLDDAAKYIKDKTDQYNTDITKLYSESESLTAGAWTGVASQEFRSKLESYRGDFEALKSELNKFADVLKKQAENYKRTEDAVANNARAL